MSLRLSDLESPEAARLMNRPSIFSDEDLLEPDWPLFSAIVTKVEESGSQNVSGITYAAKESTRPDEFKRWYDSNRGQLESLDNV